MSVSLVSSSVVKNDNSAGTVIEAEIPATAQAGDVVLVAFTCDYVSTEAPRTNIGWRFARFYDGDQTLHVFLRDCTAEDPGEVLEVGELVGGSYSSSISACLVFRNAMPQKHQLYGWHHIVGSYRDTPGNLNVYYPGLWYNSRELYLYSTRSSSTLSDPVLESGMGSMNINETVESSGSGEIGLYVLWDRAPDYEGYVYWPCKAGEELSVLCHGSKLVESTEYGWVTNTNYSPSGNFYRYEARNMLPPNPSSSSSLGHLILDGGYSYDSVDPAELEKAAEELARTLVNLGWTEVNMKTDPRSLGSVDKFYVPPPPEDDWHV